MNKRALVESAATRAGVSLTVAEAALDAAWEAISTALSEGDRVAIAGFGTFEVRERAARSGRNPRTGEPMEIPAGRSPAFKPAAALKQAVADAS